MSKTPNTESLLTNYNTSMLALMGKRWLGKGFPTSKLERIERLVEWLDDPEMVNRAIAQLTSEEKLVFCAAERSDALTLRALRATAAAAGARDAERHIRSLLQWGLLLVVPSTTHESRELNSLLNNPNLMLLVLPCARGRVGQPEPILETVQLVEGSTVRAVRTADPGRLLRMVLGLVAIAQRKKLKVNQDGSLSGAQAPTVARDLGCDDSISLQFLRAIAEASGYLQHRGGLLVATERAAGAANLPLNEGISKIWRGFLYATSATEVDEGDPETQLMAYLTGLRSVRRGVRQDTAAVARRTVVGLLQRLQVEGWMSLDDLVAKVLEIDPCFGEVSSYNSWGSYQNQHAPPTLPHDRATQWNLAATHFIQALFTFGFADLGSITGTYPSFAPPDAYSASWSAYQNPERARYYAEERAKPLWTPTPSGVVLRLTPLGQQNLWGRAAPQPTPATPPLRVGPDFEILAVLDEAPPEVLYQLELITKALPGHASDPARRYRLEKERWIAALKRGADGEKLMEQLAAWSGRPLPDNVARTLRDWASGFGQITLLPEMDLVEFDSMAERTAALKRVKAELVGDRFALVRTGALSGGVLIDYLKPRPRCVEIGADGVLRMDPKRTDLGARDDLSSFTEATDDENVLRISAAAVRASHWTAEQILFVLKTRATTDLPPGLVLAIRGWCGEVAAPGLSTAILLQLPEAELLPQVLSRPELAEHIQGTLSPTVLVVRQGRRAALAKALSALGISVGEELRLG